jgi:uncharacterized protein
MPPTFTDIITSEDQLREIIGEPPERVVAKVTSTIDAHVRDFIARSPFVVVASSDANGNVDVSPKGDPAGFVQVLDDHTLAIPDRLGNRRVDTFTNILQNPKVGLYFLIPGKPDTLRISGTATIVRDQALRETMAIKGKAPDLALVVAVEEAFIHCAKCMIRSELWDSRTWPDTTGMASLAQIMIDHGKLSARIGDMEEIVATSYRDRLY